MDLRIRDIYQKNRLFFHGLLLGILTLAMQWILVRVLDMPLQNSFYDGSLLLSHFFQLGGRTSAALIVIFFAVFSLSYLRPVKLKEIGPISRLLFITIIVMQTYAIVFIDYNQFHGEWFLADRIILAAFGIYTLFNPYFIPVYLFQLMLLIGQLQFPGVIGYDHTHKSLILPVLLSFWSFLVLNKLFRSRIKWQLYVIIFLSIISSWYLTSGIGKVSLNWHVDNNLYNLLAASVDAGWLHNASKEMLLQLAAFVNEYHLALQMGGLIVELLLPLLLFINRRLTIFCLSTFISFHLLVYLLSGIFFWQWIILEVVLILCLILKKRYAERLFIKRNIALYFILLLLTPLFMNITTLAWLDCGFINSYTFLLEDHQGKNRQLDSSFFSPYDVGIAKNRFTFTRQGNILTGTLGSCMDAELVNLTENWDTNSQTENREELSRYKKLKGVNNFDIAGKNRFEHFVKTFTKNKLNYDPKLISRIDAPLHMQQGQNQQNFSMHNIERVKILYQEKVVLPGLKYELVTADSFYVELPQN